MMYKTKIKSLFPGGAIDWAGNKLLFIGNFPVEEGDDVWTDGKVIFGNEHIKGESFLPSVDAAGIPINAVKNGEGFRGFIRKNGRRKECYIVDDDWIINSENDFFHGKASHNPEELEGDYFDVEIARDENGTPIGVYKAAYDIIYPGGPVKIYLNDELVETVDLQQIASGSTTLRRFKIHSDGSWQMIVEDTSRNTILHYYEYDVSSEPKSVSVANPGPDSEYIKKIPWSSYVAAVINNPDSDPEAYLTNDENDGFFGAVYSQEANPANGGKMTKYHFPPYEEELVPLENDTQVAQVVLNRCKRFESNFSSEAGLMVNYYNSQFETTHTSFWEMIAKWMVSNFVTESSLCPSCKERGYLKYTAQTDTSGIYPNFMDEDGNYGTMQCDNCGYTGPVKFYFWGWSFSVGFAKYDMSTIERDNKPKSKGQRHENFKMYTYDSETKEKNVFIETDVTEDVYWWSTYQIVDYISKNYGNNSFCCSDTGIVTCTFPKLGPDYGNSNDTIDFYYFSDARLRYWHYFFGPTINIAGVATHNITFAPWKWRLNDGYVAYMNIFQVLRIEDKDGNEICGELPIQKYQLKSGYIQEPYLALRLYKQLVTFSKVTAADAAVWDGDGPTSGVDSSASPGCKSFPSSTCSLFVQKLSRGYLVGFHGYKSYYVDENQNVTEIGDNTKNFRMNYLKQISKAKR